MESLATTACFRDDLLDLPSDFSDDDDDKHDVVLSPLCKRSRAFSLIPCHSPAFPGFVEEEELEWISNRDAFPMVESFVDIMPNHPSISSTTTSHNHSHLSPVSVLENSNTTSCSINSLISSSSNIDNNKKNVNCKTSNVGGGSGAIAAMISLSGIFKVPGKARSKQLRKRRREISGERFQCWEKVKPSSSSRVGLKQASIGRKCLHCGSEKTPQWRAGPLGPKTLCNACGVRYKSGRLVPEYRPASSPTFSSELHSNSHRKIVEMRKQKMPVDSDLELKPVPIS